VLAKPILETGFPLNPVSVSQYSKATRTVISLPTIFLLGFARLNLEPAFACGLSYTFLEVVMAAGRAG
jgi:hypothetical protein